MIETTLGSFNIAIIHFVIAFLLAFFMTKYWINLARQNNLTGKDMNKKSKVLVAEAGGIAVFIAFAVSVALYVFFKTFIFHTLTHLIEVLALVLTVTFACLIGFVDDILGWKKGLGGFRKILSTLPIVIPLAVIKAGQPTMALPFVGSVNLGLLYPLLVVPIALIGTTNGFNLLAGYNGLEAGLGSIIMLGFSAVFLVTGQYWLMLIALIAFFSLLGFLMFNKFPSKVFPGDSLTFMIGSLIGGFAILGNCEKIALLMFAPFIIEGFLKLRSKFKAENFAKLDKRGFLHEPYNKVYSLTHIILRLLNKIKKNVTEKDVVAFLLVVQLIIVIGALIWVFI